MSASRILTARPRTRAASRSRWPTLAVLVLLAVALAGCGSSGPRRPMEEGMMREHHGRSQRAAVPTVPGAREILVEGLDLAFEPDRIEVEAGETVNVRFTNSGRIFHDLVAAEVGFALAAQSGEEASGALRIDEPGEYGFVCTVPGHARAGMRGVIVAT